MASIVSRMKPVNPTMNERIVRNKMNDIDDASMKMVAERHDLRGNFPHQRAGNRANKRSMLAQKKGLPEDSPSLRERMNAPPRRAGCGSYAAYLARSSALRFSEIADFGCDARSA